MCDRLLKSCQSTSYLSANLFQLLSAADANSANESDDVDVIAPFSASARDFVSLPQIGSTADELHDQLPQNHNTDGGGVDIAQLWPSTESALNEPIFSSLIYKISKQLITSMATTASNESSANCSTANMFGLTGVNSSLTDAHNEWTRQPEFHAFCARRESSSSTGSSFVNSPPSTASSQNRINATSMGIQLEPSNLIFGSTNAEQNGVYTLGIASRDSIIKPTPVSHTLVAKKIVEDVSRMKFVPQLTTVSELNSSTSNSAFLSTSENRRQSFESCRLSASASASDSGERLVLEDTTSPDVPEPSQKRKKKPYKELTLEEKVELIRLAERNSALSQASIAERYAIAKSNVCRILQRRAEYLRAYESSGFAGSRKRKLRAENCATTPLASASKTAAVCEIPEPVAKRTSDDASNATAFTPLNHKPNVISSFDFLSDKHLSPIIRTSCGNCDNGDKTVAAKTAAVGTIESNGSLPAVMDIDVAPTYSIGATLPTASKKTISSVQLSSIDVLHAALLTIGQQQHNEAREAGTCVTGNSLINSTPLLKLSENNNCQYNINYNYNNDLDNCGILTSRWNKNCSFTPISSENQDANGLSSAATVLREPQISIMHSAPTETATLLTEGVDTAAIDAVREANTSDAILDLKIDRSDELNRRVIKENATDDNNNNEHIYDHNNNGIGVDVIRKMRHEPNIGRLDVKNEPAVLLADHHSDTTSLSASSSISNSPIDLCGSHDALSAHDNTLAHYETDAPVSVRDILSRYEQLEQTNSHLRNEVSQLREYTHKCHSEMESLRYRNQLLQYRLMWCREKATLVAQLVGSETTHDDSDDTPDVLSSLPDSVSNNLKRNKVVREILRIASM